MKNLIIAITLLFGVQYAFSQPARSGLGLGVAMPDYTFPVMMQYPKESLPLADLKGKIVILDFWTTGCSVCIDEMPRMQKLQDQFKDRIQIIMVNSWPTDSPARIQKTLAYVKKGFGAQISMPVALFDSTLQNYFPHYGEPFEVIIDAEGKILAQTSIGHINEANIKSLLDGKKVNFPFLNGIFDLNAPLLYSMRDDGDNADKIICSSSLVEMKEGVSSSGPKYNRRQEIIGSLAFFPLIEGYKAAYHKDSPLFSDEPIIQYQTRDSLIRTDIYGDNKHKFMYDLIVRPGQYNERLGRAMLREDLDRAFNFSFKRIIKDTACLVFRTNRRIKDSYTKYKESEGNINAFVTTTTNHVQLYGHAIPIGSFVTTWSRDLNLFNVAKVIDETGDRHSIDLEFPVDFDFKDKEKVRSFLHAKGIDITVEKRPQPVVIVSDKTPGEPTVVIVNQ